MKKIFFFIFYILILSFMTAQNQGFQWAQSFQGTNQSKGMSIAVDQSGNIYTTGLYNSQTDFDPGPATYNLSTIGNNNVFVSKLDAAGNFVWAKQLGGLTNCSGISLVLDNSANIYLAGSFTGTIDCDPGPATYYLLSNGSNPDVFILKLDASGNFVWAKQLGAPYPDEAKSISIDQNANIYITGFFSSTIDFNPGPGTYTMSTVGDNEIFILKLDSGGNFVWAKKMGGNLNDCANSITLDATGNIYTTGLFKNTADFDPGSGIFNLTTFGQEDIFISKLDNSGNFIWAKKMGGGGSDIAYAITENAGYVYTTGTFNSTADFDPGTNTFNIDHLGAQDAFISKLDASGNFIWAKNFGGPSFCNAQKVKTDSFGNVYTVGYFTGVADFDPNWDLRNLTSLGLKDIFISKLDSSGNYVWAKSFGANADEELLGFTIDATENLYGTGHFSGNVDFDPGTGTANLNCTGAGDIFVFKINALGVGIKENNHKNDLTIYPNPTGGIINIDSEILSNKNVNVQLLNTLGQILLEENVDLSHSYINIQHFSNGIYFLKTFSEDKLISTQKIIKE